jgi:hypothetical protein
MVGVNGEYGCMGDLGMHVLHVPLRLGWRTKTVHAQLAKLVQDETNVLLEGPPDLFDSTTPMEQP